jgi:hypothetical protein
MCVSDSMKCSAIASGAAAAALRSSAITFAGNGSASISRYLRLAAASQARLVSLTLDVPIMD